MSENKNNFTPEFKASLALFVLAFFLALNFVLAFSLLKTVPELKLLAHVFVPETRTSDDIVRTWPIESQNRYTKEMEELFVRQYIEARLTYYPDYQEMSYLWGVYGPVWFLSSSQVFQQFYMSPKQLQEYIKQHKETRSVEIQSIHRIDNIWTLEVIVSELDGEQLFHQTWIVNLTLGYNSSRKSFHSLLLNPQGLVVLRYKQTEKIE